MADLMEIFAANGPLPLKTSVDIAEMIGIVLSIDGAEVATAQIFSNPMETHLAVVPVTFSYTFPFTETQEHVFELDTLPGTTTSDSNDFFVVTVQY